MKKFKESFELLEKRKISLSKDHSIVKMWKDLGKNQKVDVHITKDKSGAFFLYIDGIKMDKFKSEKEAEKQMKQFMKVMGV